MWMMGYNDSGDFNFNGRRLRPLVPRPLSSSSVAATTSPNPPCPFSRFHGNDFITFNHHVGMGEQNKREFNTHQVVVSSRWNPTPEQLQTLEELYRRGTRTPSADQIQQITTQLRKYGKIEGKNVFYWFQNHKARERQKRRRQLESAEAVGGGGGGGSADNDQSHVNTTNCMDNTAERKDSGANVTSFEVDQQQTKSWLSTTPLIGEKSESIHMGTKVGMMAEGWVQFEDGAEIFQQRRSLQEKNATWRQHMISLSTPSPPPPPPPTYHHRHHIPAATSASSTDTATKLLLKPPHQPLNLFMDPPSYKDINAGSQTLQLFPLRSGGEIENNDMEDDGKDTAAGAMNTTSVNPHHYKFFEFLPLKN